MRGLDAFRFFFKYTQTLKESSNTVVVRISNSLYYILYSILGIVELDKSKKTRNYVINIIEQSVTVVLYCT